MVDSQELDNVWMPESTQYRAFFLEATSGVSYSLLVERLVELLGRAREALVLDGINGSVGASSQFISSLSYSLECVLLQSCCLIRFSSSLRHIFLAHNKQSLHKAKCAVDIQCRSADLLSVNVKITGPCTIP